MNEEDIKILEEYLKNYTECPEWNDTTDCCINKKEIQAIENLINKNKELEETLKDNWEFRDKCYIPKSKIKEKIEELKKKIKYEDNEKVIIWLHKQIRILQELLEE